MKFWTESPLPFLIPSIKVEDIKWHPENRNAVLVVLFKVDSNLKRTQILSIDAIQSYPLSIYPCLILNWVIIRNHSILRKLQISQMTNSD